MKNIYYKIKTATEEDILSYLQKCSSDFNPSLDSTVDLHEFALKIYNHAITFEAWADEILISLLGMYCNDSEEKIAFINHVSVLKPYKRIGISKKLFDQCIEYAKEKRFLSIRLEVAKNNKAANNLYAQYGFIILDTQNNKIKMIKKLVGESK